MATQDKKYRRSGRQSQSETMARVQAWNKIENAHLRSRVTNIRQQRQAAIATAVEFRQSNYPFLIAKPIYPQRPHS